MGYYICRICFIELDEDNQVLLGDVADVIMLITSIKIAPDDGLPRFICKICRARARDALNFKLLCEESDMYLQCDKFVKLDVRDPPIETSVASSVSESKTKEKLQCGSCNMAFYYKKRLMKHEQQHKEGFSCKDCGKNYASAKHLAVHVSLKKRKGSHLCQVCGKAYTMPENLRRHQRVHDGNRPFSCQICEKSFTQSNELKSHLITHSDEKKFLCSFCGHRYSRQRSLQIHITRIHSEVSRKHKCPSCEQVFKDMIDVKIHQNIHAGKRNHICKVCNKGFNKSSNLKVHEMIHTGQKPFACQICPKAFIQKHVLNKHLSTHDVQT